MLPSCMHVAFNIHIYSAKPSIQKKHKQFNIENKAKKLQLQIKRQTLTNVNIIQLQNYLASSSLKGRYKSQKITHTHLLKHLITAIHHNIKDGHVQWR